MVKGATEKKRQKKRIGDGTDSGGGWAVGVKRETMQEGQGNSEGGDRLVSSHIANGQGR